MRKNEKQTIKLTENQLRKTIGNIIKEMNDNITFKTLGDLPVGTIYMSNNPNEYENFYNGLYEVLSQRDGYSTPSRCIRHDKAYEGQDDYTGEIFNWGSDIKLGKYKTIVKLGTGTSTEPKKQYKADNDYYDEYEQRDDAEDWYNEVSRPIHRYPKEI